jgi:hypothetical protein
MHNVSSDKRTYAVDYKIMLKRIKTYKVEDFTMMAYQYRYELVFDAIYWNFCW